MKYTVIPSSFRQYICLACLFSKEALHYVALPGL